MITDIQTDKNQEEDNNTPELMDSIIRLKQWGDRNSGYIQIIGILLILTLVVFAFINWHNFQKNACQLCEDTGRKCYEKNTSKYNYPKIIGEWKRIEQINISKNLLT